MNLFEQIQEAVKYCNLYEGYRVGIFINRKEYKRVELSDLLYQSGFIPSYQAFRKTRNETLITFSNGSYIKILVARENCLWQRFNMIITDYEIDYSVKTTIIYPCLINYVNYKSGDEVKIKHFWGDFGNIWKSLCEYREEKENMTLLGTTSMGANYSFKNGEGIISYSIPLVELDEDNKHILLYGAAGIDTFEYYATFVNKTKETFLVIKGECDWYDGKFKNDINIRLKIDTDIYDGYTVDWNDGILMVELKEIINEKPKFAEINRFG